MSSRTIIHMALPEDWEQACRSGEYRMSTRGANVDEVGYIHACGDIEQAHRVWEFLYSDRNDVVLLELDEEELAAAGLSIRQELGDPNNPESEIFPHIYGGGLPVEIVHIRAAGFIPG